MEPDAESTSADSQQSLLRLARLLVVGTAVLGAERLVQELREWDLRASSDEAPAPSDDVDEPLAKFRLALLGFIAEAEQAAASGAASLRQAARRSRREVGRGLRAVGLARVADEVWERLEPLRSRAGEELDRLARLGRREEAEARRLVGAALRKLSEESLAEVAESPQVAAMVRAQTATVGREVVQGVRARTRRADDTLERLVRSLFRRRADESDGDASAPSPEGSGGGSADAE